MGASACPGHLRGASAAITCDGETLAAWSTDAANAHAEVLAPAVQQLLKQEHLSGADVDGIVVGVGPGPFTGLRVGLALAQSLAIGWRRPLHGVCSLDSLALRAVESDTVEESSSWPPMRGAARSTGAATRTMTRIKAPGGALRRTGG
ncbi:tRNA (adenosine(37)-N6)-threonylcarbamoyltransferase complex dimerization subunit type 1 TsaB [Nesterenkonia pannonica]|uniref:tRNA (adenosine(37)-N6)-threonylcarbamoyltransferase complex dimerization subunit type 1 TsaB n=1 Tax=Nesterenkonia pannonica TaxID=1548602 RepID=UPI002164D22C|nr:tRNA (adenosine(37)-N6)-threonylcarbamoyltransferase complex dimerization subunit type 1 TsaB [Nesterenkonia pannonica]